MGSVQSAGLWKVQGPRQTVLSSGPWTGMPTSLGWKSTLMPCHREKQRSQNPVRTGLVRLGPSRAWHREAGPREELAKGQEA